MMTPDDFTAADALLAALHNLSRIYGSFPADIAEQAWDGNDEVRLAVYGAVASIGEAMRDIIRRV